MMEIRNIIGGVVVIVSQFLLGFLKCNFVANKTKKDMFCDSDSIFLQEKLVNVLFLFDIFQQAESICFGFICILEKTLICI